MSQMELFWTLDFPAAASAVLASVLCAVLGCFLLVRRSAMLGDAISHAILPGIVGSFLLVGTRSTWAMLAGAAEGAVASVTGRHATAAGPDGPTPRTAACRARRFRGSVQVSWSRGA
jgi:ABC-type Mn2+/Zn2+ transport system permease subunit